jgi:subtilisin
MCIHAKRMFAVVIGFCFVAAFAAPIVSVASAKVQKNEAFLAEFNNGEAGVRGKPSPPPQPPQVTPWGISHIKANLAWGKTTGAGINVAIIDSGIQPDHPDLKGNIKGGAYFGPIKNWYDNQGHGTHIAGIVGALNNDIGVVGVAPNVNLWAIRIAAAGGSQWYSNILSAINWCINTHHDSDPTNDINVISIGSDTNPPGWEAAINSAYNDGIVIVAAAGNSGDGDPSTVEWAYPAAYPNVIAVGAIGIIDVAPYWSNTGPYVDFVAPGVDIYSTWIGSSYTTLSGTSSACPHVSGTAALVLTAPVGSYDLNGNAKWDPVEVFNKLKDTAHDLGPPGWDAQYGYGLIDALAATS